MLQSIRNKATSWFALAIIFLALFSLTFFGIGDYITTRTDTWVAKVGDEEIAPEAFRQRFQQWRQDMRQRMGDAFDPRMLEQPAFRRQILDQMIDEALLRQANERMGIVVSPGRLRSEIVSIPAFQVAGQFNEQSYRSVLANQGMSPAMFDRRLRDDIAARAIPQSVFVSAVVTAAEIDAHLRLAEQLRDFAFVRVTEPAEPVSDQVTAEERQAFYDANSAEFMSPETVTLEYIEIDAATMPVPERADEQTLRDRYDNELARFSTPEQRLASHILVRADGPDADAQRAALDTATGLVAQARAEGADFAALASEHSADLGSRGQGGDLGWVDRGQTDPAFEDALFALEAGAVSDPVRTDEGYHVILLREVRAATQQPFEEVREQLATEFQASERERLFAERSGEMIDLIYEDPGSLRPAAEALGLEIRTAGPFRRDSFDGLFESADVRDAAFSDEVLLEGQVSDAIDVSPTRRVAIRVTEHAKSEPLPLDEVAAQIDARIVAERRAAAVRSHAEALLARLDGGESLAEIAASIGAEVEQAQQVGRAAAAPEQALVAEVFRMPRPAEDAPVRRLVALEPGHALVELTRVVDGDPAAVPEARREQVRTELEQARALAESRALIATLRAAADIQVAEERM